MRTLTAAEAAILRECTLPAVDEYWTDAEQVVVEALMARGLLYEEPDPFDSESDLVVNYATPLGRLALACYVAVTSGYVPA